MNTTPTEHEEAKILHQYLSLRGITHTHICNETYTTSWKQKAKNKAEGVSPGVPDYMIILDSKLIFIELKRVKGGQVSESQKSWIAALNGCESVQAFICKGAQEGIDLIEKLQKA